MYMIKYDMHIIRLSQCEGISNEIILDVVLQSHY